MTTSDDRTGDSKVKLRQSKKNSRRKWLIAGALAYLFSANILGAREAFVLKDPILKQNGIEYAITGVGDAKQDPRWRRFPLLLEFATVKGELYADIDVRIYTTTQKLLLNLKVNAPWLVVRLKPGTYYVYATDQKGVKKAVTAVVPASGQARYTLKW